MMQLLVVLLLVLFAFSLWFFLKPPVKGADKQGQPLREVDEAHIPFARMDLEPGTTPYLDYYSQNPDKLFADEKARKLPGLLSVQGIHHNPFTFASANAAFSLIESFKEAMQHPVSDVKQPVDPRQLGHYIKSWTHQLGTHSTGIALVKDYHFYTKRGRGEERGKTVVNKHKYAIAFTVEMNHENVAAAPQSSIILESSKQYLNAANVALLVCVFLKNLGYDARAHIDGDYEVICPLVAKDAGLGEIGRMGLLMTPGLGPRARIGVVTTDAPLEPDAYEHDPTMIAFCRFCKKCADCCPGNAIPDGEMEMVNGVKRWKINWDACYHYWGVSGTDCGRCISVCPFSHPNNAMHNLIRRLIRRSTLLARVAYLGDDLLYGRKPKPTSLPRWMRMKGVVNK